MRSNLDKLPYFCASLTSEEMCDNLVGYGAVYRICFSLAAFYAAFALLMLNTTSTKDIRIKLHNGFWFLKLVLLVLILVGAFHIPRHFELSRLWMYVGLTGGFIFIMIQILLVIDFAYSWSFSWAERMESGNSIFWGFVLVSSTVLVYSITITMAVFYYLYFTDIQDLSKCRGNMFLISFNVLHCLLASIISILPRVQDTSPGSGLLQSSIVSLYTTYLTWCTLSSEPDASCNPMGDVILEYDKVSGVNGQAIFDCVLMFALLIFACNVRSSTSKLEKIGFTLSKYPTREDHALNYLDGNDAEKYIGEKYVEEESMELEYNYSFFHFVMFLASLQLMMVITNWHSPDELADMRKLVKNWATVWIQMSSSFLCVLFYIWATVTPLLVRTWGSCLGLDYESVPTEDDYERLQRRRKMLRKPKGKGRNSKSRNATEDGSFGKGIEVGNDGSNSEKQKSLQRSINTETSMTNVTPQTISSKNFSAQHDLNISEQTSEQNLGTLSLVNTQRNEMEQITEDSGVCDTRHFTSQSMSVSRESARDKSRDTTRVEASEHMSESVLDSDREHIKSTVNGDKMNTQEKRRNLNASSKSPTLTAERDGKHLAPVSLRHERTSSRLNKYVFSKKHENTKGRPHSSMALTKTSSEDRPTILPNRPHSSMAITKKISVEDDKRKTSARNPSIAKKVLPKRPHSSMAFTDRTSTEGDKTPPKRPQSSMAFTTRQLPARPASCVPSLTMQRKTVSQRKRKENERSLIVEEDTNTEYISSGTKRNAQGLMDPQINYKDPPKTVIAERSFRENEQETKNVLKPATGSLAERILSRSEDEEMFSKTDSKENMKRKKDRLSEGTTTPLKLQDHLRWVRSLRQTRRGEKSEDNVSALKQPDKHDVSVDKKAQMMENDNEKVFGDLDETCQAKLETTSLRNDPSADILENASESFHGNQEETNRTNENVGDKNHGALGQSSVFEQSLRAEERITSNELSTRNRCQSEPQTSHVAKEILRLQQKILKFQAKVVKTQQKIFEMQEEESL